MGLPWSHHRAFIFLCSPGVPWASLASPEVYTRIERLAFLNFWIFEIIFEFLNFWIFETLNFWKVWFLKCSQFLNFWMFEKKASHLYKLAQKLYFFKNSKIQTILDFLNFWIFEKKRMAFLDGCFLADCLQATCPNFFRNSINFSKIQKFKLLWIFEFLNFWNKAGVSRRLFPSWLGTFRSNASRSINQSIDSLTRKFYTFANWRKFHFFLLICRFSDYMKKMKKIRLLLWKCWKNWEI